MRSDRLGTHEAAILSAHSSASREACVHIPARLWTNPSRPSHNLKEEAHNSWLENNHAAPSVADPTHGNAGGPAGCESALPNQSLPSPPPRAGCTHLGC